MKKTAESLNTIEKFENDVVELFERMISTRLEGFQDQLNKLKTTE
jgi:phage-related minor tail protein